MGSYVQKWEAQGLRPAWSCSEGASGSTEKSNPKLHAPWASTFFPDFGMTDAQGDTVVRVFGAQVQALLLGKELNIAKYSNNYTATD